MTNFGNRLRKLRRDTDMTQRQLGKIIGVTYAAIDRYETTPDSYPSVKVLIRLANVFHVSIDYLLQGTEQNLSAENNVSGNLANSTVIQTNHGSTVFNGEQNISAEAKELLHIYNNLGVRERLKLLTLAVDLEEKSKVSQ